MILRKEVAVKLKASERSVHPTSDNQKLEPKRTNEPRMDTDEHGRRSATRWIKTDERENDFA